MVPLFPQKVSFIIAISAVLVLSGCSFVQHTSADLLSNQQETAQRAPRTSTYSDLINMPSPRGKIVATVYNFRDQTGQYKEAPASSFSTAVTQGATAMLIGAMKDSGWFIPVEREGLQNLLTERKIIRAAQKKPNTPVNNDEELPSLLAANIMLEGGIVGYDSNIRTGGLGARYFGIGASEQYRVDQVTVNLRAIDVRTGQILHSIMTTKSVMSREVSTGVFRFIEFKRLLELEAGTTTNEPRQLCVQAAIESSLIHLIAEGVQERSWGLKEPEQINSPVLQQYLNASIQKI